jgi:hypothetical protein
MPINSKCFTLSRKLRCNRISQNVSLDDMASLFDVTIRTARRWHKHGLPAATRHIAENHFLGLVDSPGWRDWTFLNGSLITPEGASITANEITALMFLNKNSAFASRGSSIARNFQPADSKLSQSTKNAAPSAESPPKPSFVLFQ